jgi:hypothetical protein
MVEERYIWLYRLAFFLFLTATCIYGATASPNPSTQAKVNPSPPVVSEPSQLQVALFQETEAGFNRVTLF